MQNVNYASNEAPAEYVCSKCGATGCKLWREGNTLSPDIHCAPCAAEAEGIDISELDADGQRPGKFNDLTCQIGWYVPAVPHESGIGWYWLCSIPPAGGDWWRRLPTLPNQED